MSQKPLAIDLFSGLGGWADGLVEMGYDVIRVDIEDMFAATGTPKPDDCLLMLQDVLTIHGKQFKNAALITSSSPCTEYSYMAMPWSLAKAKAEAIRADETGEALRLLNRLFEAQFRIQREACEAAGHHIPMVVENVRGAQPWVGRAAWNYGSYYLWGDVPALMPQTVKAQKFNPDGTAHPPGSWFAIADSKNRGANSGHKNPGFRFDGSGRSFQSESVARHVDGLKVPTEGAGRRTAPGKGARFTSRDCGVEVAEGRKGAGAGAGAEWFDQNLCKLSSKSSARKAASAAIAKIPLTLSRHIALAYHPLGWDHPYYQD